MSKKDSSGDIKNKRRQTSYDRAVGNSIAEPIPAEKEAFGKPTSREMHANNFSPQEMGRIIADLIKWKPIFEADLEEMNRNKVGRPYEYSNAMIVWCMLVSAIFPQSFGMFAGFICQTLYNQGIKGPSPSRLNERMNALADEIISDWKDMIKGGILAIVVSEVKTKRVRRVGIDSSGLNLSSPNQWRSVKWGTGPKDKGWLKIHALSDVDSGEIIAYALTDNSVGDAPLLKVLVSTASEKGHRFDKIYADGAYSSNENWAYLCRDNKYTFVTSFKSNTVPKSNGCMARGEAAKLWCELPYNEWVKVTGYGTRWKCECTFSDFKRLFPETLEARSRKGMIREILARVDAFNIYKRVRANLLGTTRNGIEISI